ncbi:flagellar hook-length control protein FliK [Marinobacter confluentis]|uniref:Flagellar hook-length control protein FliK n=1 Tax=Marinobacter confluentis TaxID=1697557 RepID=A0A4Z1C1W4_9GAMM|nr:flagellar hook-length control protein FliK [Marinobacter confluentis]TGN41228.1 flagellar hook-length control protein FliK [Marinobacter confluentis]
MSQMVLPQNLSRSPSPEAGRAPASSGPGNEKSGDSAFDTVSRSEQQRIQAKEAKEAREARQAERADDSRKAEKSQAADDKAVRSDAEADAPEKTDDTQSADASSPQSDSAGDDQGQKLAADNAGEPVSGTNPLPQQASASSVAAAALDLKAAETSINAEVDSIPVTFAGLQTLAASAQTQGAGAATGAQSNGQALPFLQGAMMTVAGLNGAGRPGTMALQTSGQNGPVSGIALSESLLAGVTADGGKAADSPMLQNAIRFQGALESAGAQANAVNTPKMAPDAPILRGYTTSIDVPVSHAEWGDKMAGKLTWLTARNMSVAEIHLTPPDMGPMEVRVQVQQDQANISVHSANPVVREQLELHSHRLRDMLNEQGFSLEQFDVSDSGRDQTGDGETGGEQTQGQGVIADSELDDSGAELQSLDLTWRGEVDIFA